MQKLVAKLSVIFLCGCVFTKTYATQGSCDEYRLEGQTVKSDGNTFTELREHSISNDSPRLETYSGLDYGPCQDVIEINNQIFIFGNITLNAIDYYSINNLKIYSLDSKKATINIFLGNMKIFEIEIPPLNFLDMYTDGKFRRTGSDVGFIFYGKGTVKLFKHW